MTQKAIPDVVRSALGRQEEVLWCGEPTQFPLMNETNRTALLARWAICAALAVALCVGYAAVVSGGTAQVKPVIFVVIAVLFGYFAAIPALDRGTILKKRSYVITNERVIVTDGTRGIFALDKKGIKTRSVRGETGWHLLFGAAADEPDKKIRVNAVVPTKEDGGTAYNGLVFYNIEDLRGAQAAL